MYFIYPATKKKHMSTSNELFTTNSAAYLQLKPICHGVNEAKKLTSHYI